MDSELSSAIKKFYIDSILTMCIIVLYNAIAFGIVLSLHKYFQNNWVIFSIITAFINTTIVGIIIYKILNKE